jgi:hypothetical protein
LIEGATLSLAEAQIGNHTAAVAKHNNANDEKNLNKIINNEWGSKE